jgi:PadR family transcriptional regulator, regulatory protein AphA
MPPTRESSTNRLPLEHAALGLLMAGTRHGYDLHAEFVEQFGAIWRAGRSQFYAALKSLEEEGLLDSATVAQESRPARKMLTLTPAGRERFMEWLSATTPHIRDVRVEFLAKLHFFRILSLPGAGALIDAQRQVCAERMRRLQVEFDESARESDVCASLVYDFRRRQIQAVIDWLEECRRFFV